MSKTILLMLALSGIALASCTTPKSYGARSATGTPVAGIGYCDVLPVGF